MTAVVD